MRCFLPGGERIGSDASQLLLELHLLLVREPLQQALIEGGRHGCQRLGELLSFFGQMKPNETVISPVVDSFDEAMLFQSLDDAGHHRSIKAQALCQGPDREILFA